MKILKYLLTFLILPLVIVGIGYAIVDSVLLPINFDKQMKSRESVAVQRLKDIRTLQTAYKSVNGKFTSSMDSLIMFYHSGKMKIVMQIGSNDDSLAVANTEKIKKANRKITNEELYQRYLKGENLVFSISSEVMVKDTLFRSRENFSIDSLRFIPYSGKSPVEMEAVTKSVSGVMVPLFEARMPYKKLLSGMEHQLIVNLVDMKEKQFRYPGLMVGNINTPNNNAGNWE